MSEMTTFASHSQRKIFAEQNALPLDADKRNTTELLPFFKFKEA